MASASEFRKYASSQADGAAPIKAATMPARIPPISLEAQVTTK